MSYQLVELKLQNFERQFSDTKPLYVSMGALSSNDATTLRVAVVVGAITGGTAALSLEESMDGGLTWSALTTSTNGPITGAGTYQVWLTESSGIVSPNVRLKVLPSAGQSAYITKVYKTSATGDVIIPRSSGGGGGGGATETTAASILTAVDGLETLVTATNTKLDTIDGHIDQIEGYVDGIETALQLLREWPYATHDAMTYSWTAGTFTEVWTYKTGGTGGTTVGTVTTVYTDATKATPVSIAYNPAKSV